MITVMPQSWTACQSSMTPEIQRRHASSIGVGGAVGGGGRSSVMEVAKERARGAKAAEIVPPPWLLERRFDERQFAEHGRGIRLEDHRDSHVIDHS